MPAAVSTRGTASEAEQLELKRVCRKQFEDYIRKFRSYPENVLEPGSGVHDPDWELIPRIRCP